MSKKKYPESQIRAKDRENECSRQQVNGAMNGRQGIVAQ